MADNGFEKLKIKPPSEDDEGSFVFSPEEMLPVEVAEALETDLISGKSEKQAKRLLKRIGYNELRSEFRLSFRESLRSQLRGMIGVLLALSSAVMFVFRPDEPTYLCMAIVVTLVTFINAFAEYRASLALRVPKKYTSLKAHAVRDGEEVTVDSRRLVPGDVIFLEKGMMVPADCRLVDDVGLAVMETHVSGSESAAAKDGRYVAREGPEPICVNMVYAGSIVTAGHASAVVVRVGKETLMRTMHPESERRLPSLLKYVVSLCRTAGVISAIISFVLLFVGVAAGADITEWFVCALAIGASSLCDGIVSLCASSLGFGSKKMTDDGIVIKNYDKIPVFAATNTVMCGKNLAFPPKRIALTGLFLSGRNYDRERRPDESVLELLKLLLVCSDAKRVSDEERKRRRGSPEYKGSPVDDAIVSYFEEWGKQVGEIRDRYIRLDAEYTLSGDISRMLALHEGKNTVIVRGAPENVLSRCVGYTLDGSDYKLSEFTRKKILAALEDSSRTNSVIIAVACGVTDSDTLRGIDAEQRLIFKGFVSFSSTLDPGVASAVYRLDGAGIETVLNSNDAYYAAYNSAKSAGIINDENQILTAEQLRSCERGLLIANAPYYRVFLNIDDGEWQDIMRMRREEGRVTSVTAERIDELPIMRESDVSLVPDDAGDTLCQTADMLMLDSGINLIADGILNAKTIVRRIMSVVTYFFAATVMVFTASVFSASYDQTPAFRTQDVMFGGIIFNLCIAFALAFAPRSIKTLREPFVTVDISKLRLTDYVYPLMFSIGGGIMLFVCFAATRSYTCSLIALTMMLFIFACTVSEHGGPFATKRLGNRLLWLVGAVIALLLAALVLTKPGHALFGYGVPSTTGLIMTVTICVVYGIVTQIVRYFLSPHMSKKTGVKRKKPKKSEKIPVYDDEDIDETEEME